MAGRLSSWYWRVPGMRGYTGEEPPAEANKKVGLQAAQMIPGRASSLLSPALRVAKRLAFMTGAFRME
jgi:hypothetical protein